MKSRMLTRASLIFLLTLGVIIDGPFARATDAISLTPSASSVAPGQTVDLTAAMPVVAAGSTTQTLTQVIDPTKVKLTSASDITFPAGWTLSYSTDGTTFSSTAPTTTAGWAAVRAVRATGDLVSSGSNNGFQVASRTATGTAVSLTPPTTSASVFGSDGYQAFFDADRTRVFNVFHHSGALTENLDCKMISTGATCVGFPFAFGGRTDEAANAVVVGSTIWAASVSGFYCIDIAAVLANTSNVGGGGSPSKCFGSGTSALVPGTSGKRLTWFTGASKLGQSAETKLYALSATSTPDDRAWTVGSDAEIYCIDTATRTLCSGSPTSSGIRGADWQASFDNSNILKVGDLLYVIVSNQNTGSNTVNCLNVTTWSRCSGWTSNVAGPSGLDQAGKFLDVPNAQGGSRGVCYLAAGSSGYPYSPADTTCWDSLGQTFTAASVNIPSMILSGWTIYGNPVRLGTRLYFGNANYSGGGKILCYDATANSNTGGYCNGDTNVLSAIGTMYNLDNYTVTPDPLIPNCVWITRHFAPIIRTIDILNKRDGCSSIAPTTASFSGSAIVPRMACNSNQDAIRQWESFTLKTAGTGTFTSATLTVKNSSGVAISGWTDRAVSLDTPLDLSTLSPGSTGLTPSFEVAFGGITGSITTASAEVKVVGDSPELCTRVTAAYVCPTGSGPITALANNTATVSANGSSVLGGATTTLPQVDQSITVIAPALSTCTSSITGRAGDGGGGSSGTAISGVTVSLLDSSGDPVRVNGSPVTTTTASDGTYSFANLLPSSYKIRFNEPGTQVLASSTVVSGATGTTTGTSIVLSQATSATSNVAATIAGTGAVVNALYTIPAAAAADTPAAGTQGSAQTINVLSNDNAASGATLTASTVGFCGLSPAQTPPSCSQTTLTTADGSYSVNTSTGVVTFTPNASFTGTATQPPTYQVTDSASNVISATITPSVIARPALTADTSSGAWDQNQTISPLANDVAGNGASLVANSVKLCASGESSPNCTATSLTITGQGTYTVNSDGTITFDPLPSFTGDASPVTYTVTDSVGQKSSTTITPSVSAPNDPIAAADTTSGAKGAAQSVNLLANDAPGIANNAGLTLVASSAKLCDPTTQPAQVAPNCTATSVTVSGVGTYSISNGVVTFTPLASFSGSAQPLPYQVADSTGQVATASYTPTVIPPPALTADTSSGAWDQNQTISPLANDVAGNGASLVANSVKLCASGESSPNCTATSLTIAGQGTYTVNADGTITFDPLPSFTGDASPVTYTVTDSVGQKSSTTITPSVSAPGAPVANPQTKLVSPTGTTAFTTITGSNGLATGTQLSPSQTFLCNVAPNAQTPPNCTATTVTTSDGTWVLSQITGVATYQPNAGTPTGTKTAITYQVSDPAGQSASALLTPVIPPAPTANPDSSSGQQASPQVISLIGNDQPGMSSSPIDVSSVKFCVGNQVAPNCSATSLTVSGEGTYTIDSFGIVTFTPIDSFTGAATPITYQVSDSIGQSTSSTLSVYVIPPPAPVATRDLGSAAYGQAIVFEPWKNDSGGAKPAGATQADPQVVPTSIRLCASGQSAPNCAATTITTVDGTYALDTTTGKVTFTPASGFSGTATAPVTYQISNNWTGPSGAATTTAILIPTIAAPGDPLATNDQSATKPETPVILKPITNDTAGSFALNASTLRLCQETDIAPNCAQLSVTNAHGTYVVDPATGGVTFTPAKGFKGIATIPYVLSDMNARFAHANLFITVSSDAPTSVTKTNEKVLAKTGTNGAYALGSLAIISAMAGTALVASSQRKQTRA